MAELRSRKMLLTIFLNDIVKEGYDFFNVLPYDVVIVSPLHHEPTNHYHLIIHHKNAISFNTLKRIFPFCHIEKQFGSNLQAYNYLFHLGEDTKEQLREEDIKSNVDIKEWLGGTLLDEKESVGIEILNAIENSKTLWQVIKSFPNYWRDVSRLKDLWNIYRIHSFRSGDIGILDLNEEERKQLNAIDESDINTIL